VRYRTPGTAQAASLGSSAAEADGSLRRLRLEIGFLVEILILGVLFVFDFDLLADLGQFQRLNADHFEVAAALGARKDFSFIELIFFNIQIALALWAQNHDYLPFISLTGDACLLHAAPHLIFRFSSPAASSVVANRNAQSGNLDARNASMTQDDCGKIDYFCLFTAAVWESSAVQRDWGQLGRLTKKAGEAGEKFRTKAAAWRIML
jgi:hypothetical protein